MVFSSIIFLFFFLPVFLILYYSFPYRLRNYVILFFSLIFYWWGAPLFVFVVLGTTTMDFLLVRQIERSSTKRRKKMFLIVSVILNLGVLFCCKYLNFFTDNLNVLIRFFGGSGLVLNEIILPIGVSFFTFESLTYVIDVYRGEGKSLRHYGNYLSYILMFPKLIAGPIVSYNQIGTQIESERKFRAAEYRLSGMYRFVLGLSKKVLIANVLARTAEDIYKLPSDQVGTYLAWMASVAYTFQLYFDFSGYSDMAIGLAKMMGFVLPENFNFPYTSFSITEFWKRWHMTLGNWMRNYLYIPLGGNRRGTARMYVNLLLVFFLSGLWHGAGYNFIIWGMIHGLFMVAERLFDSRKGFPFFGWLYTFLIVNIAWLFFRNESISLSVGLIKKMFSFTPSSADFEIKTEFFVILGLAALFSFSGFFKRWQQKFADNEAFFLGSGIRLYSYFCCFAILLLLSVSFLFAQDFNPFIYFRF